MAIHLGIDQGGTKTVAILFDEQGNIFGMGKGYGACFYYDGMDVAMEAIRQAVSGALAQGHRQWTEIKTITAGIAGVNWPEEEELMTKTLKGEFEGPEIKVYNDCLIALRAGTDKADCAVICAGTGLNIAMRNRHGRETVYNSYVDRLDQGGKGLGERILRAVFDAEIGILPSTGLTAKVLDYFGRTSVEQLLYDLPRNKLERSMKDMTFFLFELAGLGDEVATQIVREFATRISCYVVAGITEFDMSQSEVDVVLIGGIFNTQHPLLTDIITAEVHSIAPRARMVRAAYEPIIGAMKMSLEASIGLGIPKHILHNCHVSAEKFQLTR